MTIPTQQTFTDAYHKAPQYVQDFIEGDELDAAFESIRTTYKLHLDDAGVLADLLNAVILELIPLGQFEAALAEHIPHMGQDERTKVTREVNEKIFAVLRARAALPQAHPEPVVAPMQPTTYNLQPVTSVVTQKLAGPTSEVPKTVTVPMPQVETNSQPLNSKPQTLNANYKTDPYREPVE